MRPVSVQGEHGLGGLVGNNTGKITNSYATSSVQGEHGLGGLVGYHAIGNITNSYAAGNVRGENSVGGLVGTSWNGSNITNSYATGDVEGSDSVGGLVGINNFATITNSYAIGDVEGSESERVGGLVGNNTGKITNSYATGNVEGGLVGANRDGTITNSSIKTATQLQLPTAPGRNSTDVYHGWSRSDWDFWY